MEDHHRPGGLLLHDLAFLATWVLDDRVWPAVDAVVAEDDEIPTAGRIEDVTDIAGRWQEGIGKLARLVARHDRDHAILDIALRTVGVDPHVVERGLVSLPGRGAGHPIGIALGELGHLEDLSAQHLAWYEWHRSCGMIERTLGQLGLVALLGGHASAGCQQHQSQSQADTNDGDRHGLAWRSHRIPPRNSGRRRA